MVYRNTLRKPPVFNHLNYPCGRGKYTCWERTISGYNSGVSAHAQAVESEVADPPFDGGVQILLAVDDTAARLALEAVLAKSGYLIDSAASSAEAMAKVEDRQYAMVLCNLGGESEQASRSVVRLARTQSYRPATAYLTAFQEHASQEHAGTSQGSEKLLIETVNIPAFLTQVTDLLAMRAAGRAARRARLQVSA